MRVITGSLKGRKLFSVPGKTTRPTSDKIKEAIFHKLGPYFDGGIALDLFAGSGSLGIEAISRGIDEVFFIDQSPLAIQTIKKNIKTFQLEDRVKVYRNDAKRALHILSSRNVQFDLIFIDPPYDYENYEQILSMIIEKALAKQDTMIYVEYDPTKSIAYNKETYKLYYEKQFSNTTAIMILQYMP